MGPLFLFALAFMVGPIAALAIVAYVLLLARGLATGERGTAKRVISAALSAVLLEIVVLGLALIAVIVLVPRNSGSFAFGGPVLLLVLSGVVGCCGFLYFLAREAPWWCRWGGWWQQIVPPSPKEP